MSHFFGRQAELSLMDSAVESRRIVSLVGPSGVGKTTLARHWLANASNAQDVLEINCGDLDPVETAAAICEATGSAPSARISGDEFWVRAAKSLATFDALLLDDAGFELEALQILVDNWTGAVIVTQHQPPVDDTVCVLPVRPLEVPAGDELMDTPAGRLFCAVAQATNLRFDPEPSAALIAEIVAACDGLPLAIALAARLSATLSCESVRELLARGHQPEDASRPARHRSMRAAVEFSWGQLEPAQQERIFAMSLVSAAVSTHAVATLCGEEVADTATGVHDLVQMGLVSPGPDHRPLTSFADVAREAFPREHSQASSAVERRLLDQATSTARQRLATLAELHEFGDEVHLWEAALSRAEMLDDAALGAILACWTRWLALRVSATRRHASLDESRPLFDRADDWHAWQQLVWVYVYERDARVSAVIDRAKEAADTPEQLRDTLVYEAHYHHLALRHDQARQAIDRASELAEPTFRFHFFNAELLMYEGRQDEGADELARAAALLGDDADIDRARIEMLRAWCEETPQMRQARIQKARDIYRDHNMISSQAWCAHWLATSLGRDEDRFEEAWSLLEEARRMYRAIGRGGEALVLATEESSLRLHAGQWTEALELGLAVESQVAATDVMPVEPARLLRALAHWQLDELRQAAQLWRADRPFWLEANHPYLDGVFVVFDVAMLLEAGRIDEARERRQETSAKTKARLDALIASQTRDLTDLQTALELWPRFRAALDDPPGTEIEHRLIARKLRANLPQLLERLRRLETDGEGVLILENFRAFNAHSQWVDISAQSTAMRLLELLCTRDEPLDFDAIARILYPDEVITHDSLVNRINVQMSKLRRAGLKGHIVKRADGFIFDGAFTLG